MLATGYPKKPIEKTVLRFLGSRTFPHGLGRDRTPTLPAVFNIPTPRVAWKVRPDSLLEEDGFELPYADAVNLVVALPVVHVRGRG